MSSHGQVRWFDALAHANDVQILPSCLCKIACEDLLQRNPGESSTRERFDLTPTAAAAIALARDLTAECRRRLTAIAYRGHLLERMAGGTCPERPASGPIGRVTARSGVVIPIL